MPRRTVEDVSHSGSDSLDIRLISEVILQKEEDLKQWCSASGTDVGQMIVIPGSDEWKIRCPECGVHWYGGSTVLSDHDRPGVSRQGGNSR